MPKVVVKPNTLFLFDVDNTLFMPGAGSLLFNENLIKSLKNKGVTSVCLLTLMNTPEGISLKIRTPLIDYLRQHGIEVEKVYTSMDMTITVARQQAALENSLLSLPENLQSYKLGDYYDDTVKPAERALQQLISKADIKQLTNEYQAYYNLRLAQEAFKFWKELDPNQTIKDFSTITYKYATVNKKISEPAFKLIEKEIENFTSSRNDEKNNQQKINDIFEEIEESLNQKLDKLSIKKSEKEAILLLFNENGNLTINEFQSNLKEYLSIINQELINKRVDESISSLIRTKINEINISENKKIKIEELYDHVTNHLEKNLSSSQNEDNNNELTEYFEIIYNNHLKHSNLIMDSQGYLEKLDITIDRSTPKSILLEAILKEHPGVDQVFFCDDDKTDQLPSMEKEFKRLNVKGTVSQPPMPYNIEDKREPDVESFNTVQRSTPTLCIPVESFEKNLSAVVQPARKIVYISWHTLAYNKGDKEKDILYPGASEYLQYLINSGIGIVIFTSQDIKRISRTLIEDQIPVAKLDNSADQQVLSEDLNKMRGVLVFNPLKINPNDPQNDFDQRVAAQQEKAIDKHLRPAIISVLSSMTYTDPILFTDSSPEIKNDTTQQGIPFFIAYPYVKNGKNESLNEVTPKESKEFFEGLYAYQRLKDYIEKGEYNTDQSFNRSAEYFKSAAIRFLTKLEEGHLGKTFTEDDPDIASIMKGGKLHNYRLTDIFKSLQKNIISKYHNENPALSHSIKPQPKQVAYFDLDDTISYYDIAGETELDTIAFYEGFSECLKKLISQNITVVIMSSQGLSAEKEQKLNELMEKIGISLKICRFDHADNPAELHDKFHNEQILAWNPGEYSGEPSLYFNNIYKQEEKKYQQEGSGKLLMINIFSHLTHTQPAFFTDNESSIIHTKGASCYKELPFILAHPQANKNNKMQSLPVLNQQQTASQKQQSIEFFDAIFAYTQLKNYIAQEGYRADGEKGDKSAQFFKDLATTFLTRLEEGHQDNTFAGKDKNLQFLLKSKDTGRFALKPICDAIYKGLISRHYHENPAIFQERQQVMQLAQENSNIILPDSNLPSVRNQSMIFNPNNNNNNNNNNLSVRPPPSP